MQPFSIIIPVYNEEGILKESVNNLVHELENRKLKKYEILLAENGSTDQTNTLIKILTKINPQIKAFHLPNANFGESICQGIYRAKYEKVIVLNTDWWDIDFILESLELLKKYSIIIGSKHLIKTLDKRPLSRKIASYFLTFLLKTLWSYKGTDTHGLKAFKSKTSIAKILNVCVTREIIESELLLRAQRQNLSSIEIPVPIKEIRPPRKGVIERGVKVVNELIALHKDLKNLNETSRRRLRLKQAHQQSH